MQRSPSQHPFLTSGNPEQGEGSRCYSQTRENWLPSWFAIRLKHPVGVPATSKHRDPLAEVCLPRPVRGSQHFPKGVLQSLSFLHCCRGSVARLQPMHKLCEIYNLKVRMLFPPTAGPLIFCVPSLMTCWLD